MSRAKVCVVFGVGPGNGGATAVRFAAAGWQVAVVARSADKVSEWAGRVGGRGYTADATDEAAIRSTLAAIAADMGPVHTLCWNVGSGTWGDVDAIGPEAMDMAFDTNARGLFVATQAVLPGMRAAGEGNILITGATATRRGKPFTTAFAAGKAAQYSLAQSLARKLWPENIHVAIVIVDGMVDLPSTRARMPDRGAESFVSPDGFADTLLFLARQEPTAWTFELEVRPSVESW